MRGLSLVAARRGYSLVVVHGLLVVAASLVPEHRFQAQGLQQLWDAVLIPLWHPPSQTKDWTHVLCIGRWIFIPVSPGKSHHFLLNRSSLVSVTNAGGQLARENRYLTWHNTGELKDILFPKRVPTHTEIHFTMEASLFWILNIHEVNYIHLPCEERMQYFNPTSSHLSYTWYNKDQGFVGTGQRRDAWKCPQSRDRSSHEQV